MTVAGPGWIMDRRAVMIPKSPGLTRIQSDVGGDVRTYLWAVRSNGEVITAELTEDEASTIYYADDSDRTARVLIESLPDDRIIERAFGDQIILDDGRSLVEADLADPEAAVHWSVVQ